MDRAIATSSKLCEKREFERKQWQHKQRMRSVRPTVDTREPRSFTMPHIHGNLKKEQMLEERYSEIDRENRILLNKMSNIMKQPPSTSGPAPTSAREVRSISAGPQSLNRDARKKELLRITRENQMMLKRIQQAQPVYNHVEWEGVNRRNMAYLKNCAEFPLVLRSARGRPSELVPLDFPGSGAVSARGVTAESSRLGQLEDASKSVLREKMPLAVSAGVESSRSNFLVEMLTDGRTLRCSVYNEESQDTLELVVNEKSHRRLFREANGDYSRIAPKLSVVNGRLVLEEAPMALPPVRTPRQLPPQPAPAQPPPPQHAWLPREEPQEVPKTDPAPAPIEEEVKEETQKKELRRRSSILQSFRNFLGLDSKRDEQIQAAMHTGGSNLASKNDSTEAMALLNPGACKQHVEMICDLWRGKRGSLLDELCKNLRQPWGDNEELSQELARQNLARVCQKMNEEYGAKRLNPELQGHTLAITCWVLYTMTDVDIDRLFGFECPDLPEGKELPADRDEFFRPYRDKYQYQRNPQMFQKANWGARVSFDQIEKLSPVDAMAEVETWVKWLALLGSSGMTFETPISVTRGLTNLPEPVIDQLSKKQPGDQIYWAAPSSTTNDSSIAWSYANQILPVSKNVIFVISDVTEAFPMLELSNYPNEREYLLPPFSMLEVVSVRDNRPAEPLVLECTFQGTKIPDSLRRDVVLDLAEASKRIDEDIRDLESNRAQAKAGLEQAEREVAEEAAEDADKEAMPLVQLKARPESTETEDVVNEEDELEAAAEAAPLEEISMRPATVEVNVMWDPPHGVGCADVRVNLRGLTPSPDSAFSYDMTPAMTLTSFGD